MEYTESERELKSEIMDKLEDAVDEYLASFKSKSNGGSTIPSISEIEDMVSDIRSKTRDIYLELISSSLNNYPEGPLIESKKATTERKE